MMNEISGNQARALAALVTELRPDWDEAGVLKQLGLARTRGTAWDIAHAALHAAEDPKCRTPAVIPLAGEHWVKGKPLGEGGPIRFARCPEVGHTSFPIHNCGGCLADAKAAQTTQSSTPAAGVTPARVREIFERAGIQR